MCEHPSSSSLADTPQKKDTSIVAKVSPQEKIARKIEHTFYILTEKYTQEKASGQYYESGKRGARRVSRTNERARLRYSFIFCLLSVKNPIEASKHMARLRQETFTPIPHHKEIYDQLYREYVILHDYFGRGTNDVMKRLKRLKE